MNNNKNARRTDRETLMRLTQTHTAGERDYETDRQKTYSQIERGKQTEIKRHII
jgi:hypothetical protein